MARLKRLGVLFSARLFATYMALAGLVAGIVYSFGGAIHDLFTGALGTGTALAFMALIGMPLLFAGFGFLLGAAGAPLYNFLAGRFGGLTMDIEQDG